MEAEGEEVDIDPGDPAAEEAAIEAAVLRVLLVEHPTQLTVSELTLELCGDESPVPIEDAVQRLAAVGLVHRHGEFVIPSRAALYFDRLDVG